MGAWAATLTLIHFALTFGTNWSSKKTFSWIVYGSVDGGAGLKYGVYAYVLPIVGSKAD